MNTTTETTELRRRLGGVALVVAPLVLLAAALIHPKETTDPAHQLQIVAGGLNRWYLAHLLYIVGFAAFVPAVLALGSRLRASAPRLELWGAGLAVVGLFSSAGIVAIEGFGSWQLAQAADRGVAVDVLDRIVHSAGVVVPFGIIGLAVPAGLIVLAVGVARSRSAAPWVAWTLAAGAVLLAVGLGGTIKPALEAGIAAMAVAMGTIGLGDLGAGVESSALSRRSPASHPAAG